MHHAALQGQRLGRKRAEVHPNAGAFIHQHSCRRVARQCRQQRVVGPRNLGGACEHGDDRVAFRRDQGRQHVVAQAVAPTATILVAGVDHPAAPVGDQVVRQLGTAQIDERPDDVLTPRVNRGEPAGTGATHQPQQHGFRLVVASVPDGNDVGLPTLPDTFEKA